MRLPEDGDYWLARDDTQKVIESASELIADQVGDRQGAFGETMYFYIDAMLKEEKAREAYEFMVSVRPEITQYEKASPDMQGLIMKWGSLAAMSGFESFENRKAAWNRFANQLKAQGVPWIRDPADEFHTWNYLMNGEVEQAVDHFLKYELSEPLAENLDRHFKRNYQVFAPVYDDPRVAAKLSQDAVRYQAMREEVRAMLQRPEWQNP